VGGFDAATQGDGGRRRGDGGANAMPCPAGTMNGAMCTMQGTFCTITTQGGNTRLCTCRGQSAPTWRCF
jgi:hypothetical protein